MQSTCCDIVFTLDVVSVGFAKDLLFFVDFKNAFDLFHRFFAFPRIDTKYIPELKSDKN